jgi:hypothetical protein
MNDSLPQLKFTSWSFVSIRVQNEPDICKFRLCEASIGQI